MENKSIGFTIGKFAPLHKGHQLLIETALKEMDEVYCVIYDTDIININVEQRAKWIKKLYPNVNIIFAYDSPKQYGLDDESVNIQMKYLSELIKEIQVTHFYSSELYGEKVANYLGIENRIVDLERKTIPINATEIRKNYDENKKYIERFILLDLKDYKQGEKIMSEITKKALATSLKKLVSKKELSKITVVDITKDCGVNR